MLVEEKVLVSVEVGVETSVIQVKWSNRILRDGEPIADVPHRKAYSAEQREEFLAEVEGAEAYLPLVGWQSP